MDQGAGSLRMHGGGSPLPQLPDGGGSPLPPLPDGGGSPLRPRGTAPAPARSSAARRWRRTRWGRSGALGEAGQWSPSQTVSHLKRDEAVVSEG